MLHPRRELLRVDARKAQQRVRQIALHVDQEARHTGAQRLLDRHHEQTRLAAPGHA
jgi:hypothetical protein